MAVFFGKVFFLGPVHDQSMPTDPRVELFAYGGTTDRIATSFAMNESLS